MKSGRQIISRFFNLYIDGFKNLSSSGKRLWMIILIKLFIMFVILKLFFFPDILKMRYDNDKERGEYVLDQLIKSSDNHDR